MLVLRGANRIYVAMQHTIVMEWCGAFVAGTGADAGSTSTSISDADGRITSDHARTRKRDVVAAYSGLAAKG